MDFVLKPWHRGCYSPLVVWIHTHSLCPPFPLPTHYRPQGAPATDVFIVLEGFLEEMLEGPVVLGAAAKAAAAAAAAAAREGSGAHEGTPSAGLDKVVGVAGPSIRVRTGHLDGLENEEARLVNGQWLLGRWFAHPWSVFGVRCGV